MARILVVDDSLLQRKKIEKTLVDAGFLVDLASDGNEALKQRETNPYDLVITDLHMPGLDGLGLIRSIRENDKELPILVITSDTQEPVEEECRQLGVQDFLGKPINFSALPELVQKHLEEMG